MSKRLSYEKVQTEERKRQKRARKAMKRKPRER
jgi:hypothetical protein